MEIFKPIPNYEGFYSINEYGTIRGDNACQGQKVGRIKTSIPNHKGYLWTKLTKNKIKRSCFIARLVAQTFIGDIPDGYQVNHKDGIKTNNHFSNLEYVTPRENVIHAFKNKLSVSPKGEKQGNSKLITKQVIEIREKYAKGNTSHRKLAKEYGVNDGCISLIIRRINWKHI